MDDESIQKLTIPAADNAVLFLWATAPKLREALTVMEKWGFNYRTHLIWLKSNFGLGTWVRGRHELLLLGVKGEFPVPEPSTRPASVFEAPNRGHSKKPDIVYEIIEKMLPDRKYLELFARGHARTNWTAWGDEASNE